MSLREEIALARYAAADSLKPNPRPVCPNGSTDASQHHHSTDTTGTPYASCDVWTPASGSWICSSSSSCTFWAAAKASCPCPRNNAQPLPFPVARPFPVRSPIACCSEANSKSFFAVSRSECNQPFCAWPRPWVAKPQPHLDQSHPSP